MSARDVLATGAPPRRAEYPAWIVPLLDDRGALCGSGIAVTARHLLTCNHVAISAERTQTGARLTVVHTEPDERVDLALLRCEPALHTEPATFLTAHDSAELQLLQARICYWHDDSQGLRALTARPLGLSAHTDALGLHFINLAEGLPHGASGGAGLCQTACGPVCFGIVRWGGERRPCSTLTGADAVRRFLAATEVAADARWINARDAGSSHEAKRDPARLWHSIRLAGMFGALSLLGAALWSSATGSVKSGTPLSTAPAGMVKIPGGSFVPGSSEAAARADYLECTRVQGPLAARECGGDFRASIFAREVQLAPGVRPAPVRVAAFFLDRREITAAELAAWLSRRASDFEIVRDSKQLQAWGLPAPVVVSRAGRRIAAVHDGRPSVPDSVSIRVRERDITVAPEEREQPARLVSWYGADAYCASSGKRLPAAEEWEWTARAQGRFRFSWGDRPPACSDAVFGRRDGQACAQLRHRPEPAAPGRDRSPLGVLDLSGNVSEWTASSVGEGLRQVRGGHYADAVIMLVASRRSQAEPEALSPHVGFRCALDADEASAASAESSPP